MYVHGPLLLCMYSFPGLRQHICTMQFPSMQPWQQGILSRLSNILLRFYWTWDAYKTALFFTQPDAGYICPVLRLNGLRGWTRVTGVSASTPQPISRSNGYMGYTRAYKACTGKKERAIRMRSGMLHNWNREIETAGSLTLVLQEKTEESARAQRCCPDGHWWKNKDYLNGIVINQIYHPQPAYHKARILVLVPFYLPLCTRYRPITFALLSSLAIN